MHWTYSCASFLLFFFFFLLVSLWIRYLLFRNTSSESLALRTVPPPCVAVAKIFLFSLFPVFIIIIFFKAGVAWFSKEDLQNASVTDSPHLPALFARGSAHRRGGVHIFILSEREIGGHLTFYSFFPPGSVWRMELIWLQETQTCLACLVVIQTSTKRAL